MVLAASVLIAVITTALSWLLKPKDQRPAVDALAITGLMTFCASLGFLLAVTKSLPSGSM
jgi:hypothetical protein